MLLSSDKRRIAMARDARKKIVQDYAWDAIAEDQEAVWRRTYEERKKA